MWFGISQKEQQMSEMKKWNEVMAKKNTEKKEIEEEH